MGNNQHFFNLIFFLSNHYFFTTGAYIMLKHDVNSRGKHFLSVFDQYAIASL